MSTEVVHLRLQGKDSWSVITLCGKWSHVSRKDIRYTWRESEVTCPECLRKIQEMQTEEEDG